MGRYSRGQRVYSAWHWAQQAGWKFQRFWWHLLETWPFSSLAIFIKSLPLLALWLSLAFVAFQLLPPSLKTPDKETLSLLVTLITALIGFGVQQWKILTEEERSKQQKCQEALDEIARLKPLIQSDPSEGARCYVELAARGDNVWKSSRVRSTLEDEWNAAAPVEIRHIVELSNHLENEGRFYKVARHLGAEKSAQALEWAMEHLDDEWRQKVSKGLSLLDKHREYRQHVNGQSLLDVEQGPWRAVLRAWPHISLWRGFPLPADLEIAKGLDYLGLVNNPFGSGEAETDTLLLACRVHPPWWGELHSPQTALLVGASGAGKTATALLAAYDGLYRRDAFPVYYPAAPGKFTLDEIAQVVARTLLHYLAVAPIGYLKSSVAEGAAMAHLLFRYMSPSLVLRFHQASLPLSGDGAKVLREIEALAGDSSCQKPLPSDELLALLSEARPYGFRYTMLLLDVHEQAGKGKDSVLGLRLQSLLDLSNSLARAGIFTKAFLPDAFRELLCKREEQPPLKWMELQWSDDDLSALLKARLAQFGEEMLAAWCDPEAKSLSPDARLVRAAQDTPRGLICKGNELLRHIGKTRCHLTADDLDKILGRQSLQVDDENREPVN